jgi:hypothetical protein
VLRNVARRVRRVGQGNGPVEIPAPRPGPTLPVRVRSRRLGAAGKPTVRGVDPRGREQDAQEANAGGRKATRKAAAIVLVLQPDAAV